MLAKKARILTIITSNPKYLWTDKIDDLGTQGILSNAEVKFFYDKWKDNLVNLGKELNTRLMLEIQSAPEKDWNHILDQMVHSGALTKSEVLLYYDVWKIALEKSLQSKKETSKKGCATNLITITLIGILALVLFL